jgi:hypothetical protein
MYAHFAARAPALADLAAAEEARTKVDIDTFFHAPPAGVCWMTVNPVQGRAPVNGAAAAASAARGVAVIGRVLGAGGPPPFSTLLPFWIGLSAPADTPVTVDLQTVFHDLRVAATFLCSSWTPALTALLHEALHPFEYDMTETALALDIGPAPAVRLMAAIVQCATMLCEKLVDVPPADVEAMLPLAEPVTRAMAVRDALRTDDFEGGMGLLIRRTEPALVQFVPALRSDSPVRFAVRPWVVTFEGEDAIDAGGPSNELFELVAESIFGSARVTSAVATGEFIPNPNADLTLLRITGAFIAVCIRSNHPVPLPFCGLVWRALCGKDIGETDVSSADPALAAAFRAVRAADGVGQRWAVLDWTGHERKLRETTATLTPGEVEEWIKLAVKTRIDEIALALKAMHDGFQENASAGAMKKVFLPEIVRELAEGSPDIDIPTLRAIVQWSGHLDGLVNPIRDWFWTCVREMRPEDRVSLLKFATAHSRIPRTSNFFISVIVSDCPDQRLPEAHTCFNQLVIPQYQSLDKMRQCLLIAIRNCATMDQA